MQELKKPLFDWMFFLAYGFESKRTVSQNWLADVTDSLKQLVPFFCEYSCIWDSAEVKPVLQKSFIMFCLDLFYCLIFFPLFQTALQTLELCFIFCFL